jgi:hypothetical protein
MKHEPLSAGRLGRTHTRLLLVIAAWVACSACAPQPRPHPTAPAAPPLHEGPLTDYVPSAGLRWMVVGKPRAIAEHPELRRASALLFPEERLKAFAENSGVDLPSVDAALAAGFDFGTLYAIVPPRGAAPNIVRRFRDRLVSGERMAHPHPSIDRVSGIVGATPELLVRVDDQLVAIAVGDPTPGRVVEAFARNKLRASPSALKGAALSLLARPPANAVATFYAPGPFTGAWAHGARGLLADTLALSISLVPVKGARGRFYIELAGDFPAAGADELSEAFQDLAHSGLGKLLALDRLESAPVVHERAEKLLLEVELDLVPIASGLRAAVIADLSEILNPPREQRAK